MSSVQTKFQLERLKFDLKQLEKIREGLREHFGEPEKHLRPLESVLPEYLVKMKHRDSLKVLAFSDYRIHDIGLLVNLVRDLHEKPGVILYAGDDIDRFVPSPKDSLEYFYTHVYRESAEKHNYFEELARESRHGLGVVMGNADSLSLKQYIKGDKVHELHSTWLKIGSYLIMGLEGVPVEHGIGICKHAETDYRLRLELAKSLLGKRDKLIVVSHAPPHGILDRAMRFSKESIGSRALREFLEEFDGIVLVVCGHVHRFGGRYDRVRNATVVNVSSHDDYYSRANIAWIIIDSDNVNIEFKQIPSPVEQVFREVNKSLWVKVFIDQLQMSNEEAELFIKAYERFGDKLLEDLEHLASLKFRYGFTWDNVFKFYAHGIKFPEEITEEVYLRVLSESSFPHNINIKRAYLKLVREREAGIYLLSPPPISPSDKLVVFDVEYIPSRTPVLYGFLDLYTGEIKQFWYNELDKIAEYLESRKTYMFVHWGGEDRVHIQRVNRNIRTVNLLWFIQTSLVAPVEENTLRAIHDVLCGHRDDTWWNIVFYEMDGFIKLILCNRVLEAGDSEAMKLLSDINKADLLVLAYIIKKLFELPVKTDVN